VLNFVAGTLKTKFDKVLHLTATTHGVFDVGTLEFGRVVVIGTSF
jgi:hypothetical protein